MDLEEITIKDTRLTTKGSLIRIIKNKTGHGINIGSLCRIGKILTKESIKPAVEENVEDFLPCTIHISEFVILKDKKKRLFGDTYEELDLKHLDKVVLPEGHKQAILETLAQETTANKKILFDDWGFKDHFEKGRGIIFMFFGMPGTGKTMCAELMAKSLRKDHLMLTTAEIQSSVPGQAERNIQDAFKQATSNNLLVIIDECDALLYDRNSVGAIMGAEINCLLSEIERFDGVVVMTTNRSQKLDPALERRIALKLQFPKPNKDIRKKIWKKLIPEKCPLAKDVSFEKLSIHNICGGNIKNIIFASARRALYNKKEKVCMSDFTESIKREIKGKTAFDTTEKRTDLREVIENEIDRRQGNIGKTKGVGKWGKYRLIKEIQEISNEG